MLVVGDLVEEVGPKYGNGNRHRTGAAQKIRPVCAFVLSDDGVEWKKAKKCLKKTTREALAETRFDDNANIDVAAAGAKHLLSGSRDQTVKLWDMETGFCEHTFSDHTDWVRCLAIRQNDGAIWASSGNDQVIYVYDHATRKKLAELRGHEHVVESLAFLCEEPFPKSSNHQNSKHTETVRDYLASGGRDRTVRLWSISSASCLAIFSAHENWVKDVLIHPSGNYLVSGGDDRTIRVFDIKANRCLRTLENAHNHFITAIDMHHTLPVMVSGGVDQTVKSWVLD